jgi:serine/threonine-protein kinase
MLNDLSALKTGSESGMAPRSTVWSGKSKKGLLLVAGGVAIILMIAGGYMKLRDRTASSVPVEADRKSQPVAPVAVDEASSIAVLPFVNLSADPNNEYFSDGLTEDLIHALAKTDLRVVSRTSVFQFKNRAEDIREVGEALSVGTVLEGTVRKSDQELVITASLVNVSDGYQLWSGRFERRMSDVFAIQNEISTIIVQEMEIELAAEQKRQPVKRYTENVDAYSTYLKGRYYWNIRSPDALLKAIQLFEDAIALDAEYALAYAGLADAHLMAANYGPSTPAEAYRKARAAALKAIQLDDKLAEAHASLALLEWIANWDWDSAEREFQRALALGSAYATTHHWYSMFLAFMGNPEGAIAEINRALVMDPVSHIINSAGALILYCAEEYDAAIGQSLKTLDMKTDFVPAYTVIAKAYAMKGMYGESIDLMQKSINIAGRRPSNIAWLGYIYARAGRTAEALDMLEELQSSDNKEEVTHFDRVVIYVGLGETDKALQWLEQAYGKRGFEIFSCQADPMLAELRDHPDYKAMMERIGFPIP